MIKGLFEAHLPVVDLEISISPIPDHLRNQPSCTLDEWEALLEDKVL